jgi:uncharacterized protein YegP (UPF0339 family)
MATAPLVFPSAASSNGDALTTSPLPPMQFRISEDNGGDFHWTLVKRGGENMARSPAFASYQDAQRAAQVVLTGAGFARVQGQRTNGL